MTGWLDRRFVLSFLHFLSLSLSLCSCRTIGANGRAGELVEADEADSEVAHPPSLPGAKTTITVNSVIP